jgi:hypothetical protein
MASRVGKAEASVTSLPRAHSLAFPLIRESRKLTFADSASRSLEAIAMSISRNHRFSGSRSWPAPE